MEQASSDLTQRTAPTSRPTSWWLATLKKRAARMHDEYVDLSQKVDWSSPAEQKAAIKFFNAAFTAEESGLQQAHQLADEVATWDADLAEVLRLYGNEEGWHRELVSEYLAYLGGSVQPMGRVTRTFYRLHARAQRMETIILVNLMFEIIGATTYRMALSHVRHPTARHMLTILTRDESFHVPLNVHFLLHVFRRDPRARRRVRPLFYLLFFSLLALPTASRPKARAFDGVRAAELRRGYAEQLASLFLNEPDLGLTPPSWALRLLGLDPGQLKKSNSLAVSSIEAAERAADRTQVQVTAL